jgi:cell division protein FtsI/penicillin-binding protein 2
MVGVLQNSINTGAVFMEQKLGANRFVDYLQRFGFGSSTGIEISGEPQDIFRKPDDPGWSPVDVATQAFGQAISVTPIQMVTAFAAAINGGNLLKPHLVKSYVDPDGTQHDVRTEVVGHPVTAETSATVRFMLGQVINQANGTYPGKPKDYSAGGKSGTANVPITNGYDDTQIASFIGFAPLESPRVIILVKLDQNQDFLTGSAAAAPVFATLADQVLHYMNVNPDPGKLVAKP